jgi:hypothetical protein
MPITTTPSGGPQGGYSTYTPIYAQTLSNATSSITFSNIPTTFTDLVLVIEATSSADGNGISAIFNGDTSGSYSFTYFLGNGTSTLSGRSSGTSWMNLANVISARSTSRINIQNYSNATTFKTVVSRSSLSSKYDVTYSGLWRNTAPISSIRLNVEGGSNFNSGSTFTLYGIKAAAPAPKATGGDVITTDGTYWYHTFTTTGILDVKTAVNVDYLVVAGGAGAGAGGGGGGAGGLRSTVTATGGGGSLESQLSLVPVQYVVAVGAGGAGAPNGGTAVGTNGGNSSFSTITSIGGGGGGSSPGTQTGANGGSGGGSHNSTYSSGTANQGYRGGIGPAGAGGGAGAVGGNFVSSGSTGGTGGAGVQISALANPTGTGVSGFYAGGGGGSGGGDGTAGAGGAGGGGAGSKGAVVGVNGTSNTGGGAGSGGTGPASTYIQYGGGNGGSGIVIVRYAV